MKAQGFLARIYVHSQEGVQKQSRSWGLTHIADAAAQTSHFTPAQAGQIFDKVKPRLSVIHHATVNDASREQLISAVRAEYPSGPLVINEDLAVYEITKVRELQGSRF
jgi:hypothetical protein